MPYNNGLEQTRYLLWCITYNRTSRGGGSGENARFSLLILFAPWYPKWVEKANHVVTCSVPRCSQTLIRCIRSFLLIAVCNSSRHFLWDYYTSSSVRFLWLMLAGLLIVNLCLRYRKRQRCRHICFLYTIIEFVEAVSCQGGPLCLSINKEITGSVIRLNAFEETFSFFPSEHPPARKALAFMVYLFTGC